MISTTRDRPSVRSKAGFQNHSDETPNDPVDGNTAEEGYRLPQNSENNNVGNGLLCGFCGIVVDSARSLRAHKRGCIRDQEERLRDQNQDLDSARQAKAIQTNYSNNHSPVMNHSANEDVSVEEDTGDDELLRHDRVKRRLENVKEISKEQCIQLPKNNTDWKTIDNIAKEHLVYTDIYKEENSLQEKFTKTNKFVYGLFEGLCGGRETKEKNVKPNKADKRKDEEIEIKKKKKELKKKWKQASDGTDLVDCKRQFFKLLRLHNKLRKSKLQSEKDRNGLKEKQEFRKNPYKFAKKLLNPEPETREPKFDKEVAEKYFKDLYVDNDRGSIPSPPKSIPVRAAIKKSFDLTPPTKEDIVAYIKKRKNSSKGGPNQIQYVMLKKCPTLMNIYVNLIMEAWQTLIVDNRVDQLPTHWTIAKRKLMPKTDDLTDPSQFRDINLSNIDGKIFFGILSKRAGTFMTDNAFINTSVQKGYIRGIPGVLEHTYMITETLQNAKQNQRQICISWLDLKNAFGNVRHDIINYAMKWYGWPREVQRLIHQYYSELYVQVETRSWCTDWIPIEKGIFQGDTIADSLFNLPWNLCLEMVQSSMTKGYQIKEATVENKCQGYVDDLTLITATAKQQQQLLNIVADFLEWSNMQAKPQKCKSFAMKVFTPSSDNQSFQPSSDKAYSSYDPKLNIQGEPIPFLGGKPFKMLGKYVSGNNEKEDNKRRLLGKLKDFLEKVEKSSINGIQKAWIYEHMIIPSVTWEMTIYDFPITFIDTLNSSITKYLKSWLRITRSADPSILYRSKKHFGLNLPNVVSCYKKAQIRIEHKMKVSKDNNMRCLYEAKRKREEGTSRWKPTKHLESTMRNIMLDEMAFSGKCDKGGLGYRTSKKVEYKKKLSDKSDELDEDARYQHAVQLAMQGQWTKWDKIMNQDTSWKSLLYGYNPSLLSFALNGVQLTLPTPDNLKRWGKNVSGKCKLCAKDKCTLLHILAGCYKSLEQGRYTWRHDSILKEFEKAINQLLEHVNKLPDDQLLKATNKIQFIDFVKEKEVKKKAARTVDGLLFKSNDWEMQVDSEQKKLIFPVHVVPTSQRPDIVLISNKIKHIIMIELTSPMEENIAIRNDFKRKKYEGLVDECKQAGWIADLFCIEVGARGFISNSVNFTLKRLGFSWKTINRYRNTVSKVALRCSYAIYLQRNSECFTKWRT